MYKSKLKTNEENSIATNCHFNIIDILLLDHGYLKECIENLKVDDGDKKLKYKYAKCFLDALKKHSAGEKKALYAPLEEFKELKFQVLENEIEHGIVDAKVKSLCSRLAGIKTYTMEMDAEFHVLATLVERHIEDEEQLLFPIMKKNFDASILNQMGHQFMVFRQFTQKDLAESDLKEEIPNIKKSAAANRHFMQITHDYFSSAR